MNDTRFGLFAHMVQAIMAIASLTWLATDHLISGAEALAGILAAAGITTLSQLVTNVQLSAATTARTTSQALAHAVDTVTTAADETSPPAGSGGG